VPRRRNWLAAAPVSDKDATESVAVAAT
jgi:hypothetical protein